ncbi:RluA family pseudouridine synthase [bacterium]|nr:RluA family pseudouridine synthase [bacterium]
MATGTSFQFTIPANKGKERLDLFLARNLGPLSRARIQKVISQGEVLVDGRVAKASHKVSPHEHIEICVPKPQKVDILPENIPLDIVYEDESLLVVNKKAGMVVHPAVANYTGTLVNALMHHCGDLSSMGGRQRPGIVHRLDKDTSGLMVVAKDDVTHVGLSRQFSEKTAEREYYAIAWWPLKKRQGRIETEIARSVKNRTRMTVSQKGKQAVTEYRVIEEFDFLSLLQLNLKTGRTHQIRVHLSFVGHPVFGDPTYRGRNRQLGRLTNSERKMAAELLLRISRQALHAKTLGFLHPIKSTFMRFESNFPEDMKHLLELLRNDSVVTQYPSC